MSSEHYLLTEKELKIVDPELNIDLVSQVNIAWLPLDLEKAAPSASLVLDRDGQGSLLSAYLLSQGKRHGQCRYFSSDGNVRAEMFYQEGKLHGPSTVFGEKGQVLGKSWYFEGKKIGKTHLYFSNGALSSVQRFFQGEWEGIQEYFYDTGAPKSLIPFVKGKLEGEVRLFWESGLLKRTVGYVRGLREGWDRIWNEKGILIDEGEYKVGHPIGPHRHFFATGQVAEELYFHTPLRFDRRQWNENGTLKFEGVFDSDLFYVEKKYSGEGTQERVGRWHADRICFD